MTRVMAASFCRDIEGNSLHIGDTVCKVEFEPNAMRRTVTAIGKGEHIDGLIKFANSIAWEYPRSYRKVQ